MKNSLSVLILSVCCLTGAARAGTNLVSIHLLEGTNSHSLPKLDALSLKNLKLISPPVLADSDFVAFDATNHTFAITAEAAERLAQSIWSAWKKAPEIYQNGAYALIPFDTPFVLKASDQCIYAGVFEAAGSPCPYADTVTIQSLSPFIQATVSRNNRFSFSVNRDDFRNGVPDPRGDPRLIAAVERLLGAKKK